MKLTVNIGLTATWRDVDATMTTLGVGTWTDISNRVLSFNMDRGRQDRTAAFEPGHISMILDGSDRMLDPLYPSSYVWSGSVFQQGGQFCPIKVDATYQGNTYRIFTGYISGELWRNRRTVGSMIEVDVSAVDRMGLFAQLDLPGSPFAAAVQLMAPDWWIRGIGGDLFAANSSPLIDSSPNGYYTSMTSATSGQVIYQRASMISGDSDSAMAFTSTVQVATSASGAVAPTAGLTAFCMWAGSAAAADQSIMVQQDGAIVRWKVLCSTAGAITAIVYDAGGTAVGLANAPANPSGGGRWDDNQAHAIVFQFYAAANQVILAVDDQVTLTSSTLPATTAGAFIFGTGGAAASFDEVTWWRRVLTATERQVLSGAARGTLYGFAGDTISARVARWWQLAGVPADASEAAAAHHVPPGTDTMLSLYSVPANLADAIRNTIGSFGGVAWTQRDGRIRVRTLTALTLTTYRSSYRAPVARLSDAPSALGTPPPLVRREPVAWSGVRADRIINVSTAAWAGQTYTASDSVSLTRYGAREHRWTCDATSPLTAFDIAGRELQAFSSAQVEMDPVRIDPYVDANAATFAIANCELERAVSVYDRPQTGPTIAQTMNVQGEHWRWQSGTDWAITLDLAPSVPFTSGPGVEPEPILVDGGTDTGMAVTLTGHTEIGVVPAGWAPRSGHSITQGTVVGSDVLLGNMTYRNAAGQPTGTKMPFHILGTGGMQVIDVPTSTGYTDTIGTNGLTGGADISDVIPFDLGDGVARVACVSFQPYFGWNIATYGEHPAYLVFYRTTDGSWAYDATRSKTMTQLYNDAPSGWRASLLVSATNGSGETYYQSPGLNELTICPVSGHLLAACYYPATGTRSGSVVAINPSTSKLVAYLRLPDYGASMVFAAREIKASRVGTSGDERAIVLGDCSDGGVQTPHTAVEVRYNSTTATITATSAPFLPHGDSSDWATIDYSSDGTLWAASHNNVTGLPGLASRAMHVFRPGFIYPSTGSAYGLSVDPTWAVYGMGQGGSTPFAISIDDASGLVATVGAYGGNAIGFQWTGGDPVNNARNPTFASNSANWSGRLFSATTAWDSGDSGRLKVTSLVATGSSSAKEDWIPITPDKLGQSLWATAQVRAATTARSACIGIEFGDSAGAVLAAPTVLGPYRTDDTGSITELRVGATVPAGAIQFRTFVAFVSPAVSEVHYLLGYTVGFAPGNLAPSVNVASSRFVGGVTTNFRQVGIRGRSLITVVQPYSFTHTYPSAPYDLASWVIEIPLALFGVT